MKNIDRDFIGQLSRWHTGPHRDKKARPDRDEVLIDERWEIIVSEGSDIIIRTAILGELVAIAKEELQNAERALELVRKDYRLGYGYTYGRAYTPDLIEKKIEHTRNVIEKEIPQFAYYYGTHLFEDEPDEFEEGGWNVVS